jgi:hypothetical protein
MRLFSIILLLAIPVAASAQRLGSSTFIVGAGGAFPVSGYQTFPFHTGLSVAGEYELGLHRFFAANIGVDNFVMNVDNFTRFGSFLTRERVTLMPFGLRAIAPLGEGRGELFAGTGGAYLWTSDYDLHSFGGGLLWQLNGGVRVAIDRAKHFRVGGTARFYRDLGRPTQEWVSVTGDFSVRFGR